MLYSLWYYFLVLIKVQLDAIRCNQLNMKATNLDEIFGIRQRTGREQLRADNKKREVRANRFFGCALSGCLVWLYRLIFVDFLFNYNSFF